MGDSEAKATLYVVVAAVALPGIVLWVGRVGQEVLVALLHQLAVAVAVVVLALVQIQAVVAEARGYSLMVLRVARVGHHLPVRVLVAERVQPAALLVLGHRETQARLAAAAAAVLLLLGEGMGVAVEYA